MARWVEMAGDGCSAEDVRCRRLATWAADYRGLNEGNLPVLQDRSGREMESDGRQKRLAGMSLRTCSVVLLLGVGVTSCGNGSLPVADAPVETVTQTPSDPDPTTSATTTPVTTTEVTHASDVLPGLGRSLDAQARDEFLAAYQVYLRELELHRCMADQNIQYAVQVDYPSSFEPLLGAAIDAQDGLDPLVSDLERTKENGPIEFADESKAVVVRINLDLSDSILWNEDQAAEIGDRWWLARYGVTLSEIDVAGEEGFGRGGCEADYWSAVPSVWELRDKLRPFVDAYPKALQEQSFQDCRQEFGFSAESLGDLEETDGGSEGGLFEECLRRWDAAGQAARQTVEQGEVVAELEVRFAQEIAEQRMLLVDATTDPNFLALLQALR